MLDLVDARDDRAMLWIKDEDTAGLSPDQKRAVENIGRSPWLVQPLSAPAGAGKTTSMRALRAAAHRRHSGTVLVLAPTGKAVDVAVREGAGDEGLDHRQSSAILARRHIVAGLRDTLVVVDEAAMVGTGDLHQLLRATTAAGTKTVLVGDAAPAGSGQGPRWHVRPTLRRPALDTDNCPRYGVSAIPTSA